MKRLPTSAACGVLASLLLAAPAWAGDNGEGLLGETNDRLVTFFSFGVILFFFLVVCLGSYIQSRLERRKEARKASALKQSIGW